MCQKDFYLSVACLSVFDICENYSILICCKYLKIENSVYETILKIDSSLLQNYSCFFDRRTEDCGEGTESTAGIC